MMAAFATTAFPLYDIDVFHTDRDPGFDNAVDDEMLGVLGITRSLPKRVAIPPYRGIVFGCTRQAFLHAGSRVPRTAGTSEIWAQTLAHPAQWFLHEWKRAVSSATSYTSLFAWSMRRDESPESPHLNGSVLPIPSNGLRSISLTNSFMRLSVFPSCRCILPDRQYLVS